MANGAATIETAGNPIAQRADTVRSTGFSIGRTLAVTRKELNSYYAFPLVYILTAIFLALAGFYAWTDLNTFLTIAFARDIIQNYWQLFVTDLRMCMMLTLPFITMRQFAEERKLGTVELLYTYPLRDGEILGGKFVASVVIFLMMLGLTAINPIYVYTIHSYPIYPVLAGYFGLVLMGFAFISAGLFVSSLCESQVVAGVGTITLLFIFWALNWDEAAFQNSWLEVLRAFSLFDQFGGFAKGVIDLDHATYFVFFTIFFLFLTMKSMEARKWTGRR
jgi:ABC-2 type transport system permease protein